MSTLKTETSGIELNPSLKLPSPSLLHRCILRSSHYWHDPTAFLAHSFESWLILDQGSPLPVVPYLGDSFDFAELPANLGPYLHVSSLVSINVSSWGRNLVCMEWWLGERMLGNFGFNMAGLLACGLVSALAPGESLALAILCANVVGRFAFLSIDSNFWGVSNVGLVFGGASRLLFVVFIFDHRVVVGLLRGSHAFGCSVCVGVCDGVVWLDWTVLSFLVHGSGQNYSMFA